MSVREILQSNQFDVYCKDLTLSGNLNMNGDLQLDDVIVNSTTNSTSVTTGALIGNGGVGIAKNLTLATIGGVSSPLNYYEELNTTMLLSLFASTAINVRFTRIGRVVTFETQDWQAQYSTQAYQPLSYGSFPYPSVAPDMPVRFRPNTDKVFYSRLRWQNAGEDPYTVLDGFVTIASVGTITWSTYEKKDNTYTLNVGASAISISWTI